VTTQRLTLAFAVAAACLLVGSRVTTAPAHPRLLFDAAELAEIRATSTRADLAPVRARLLARAEHLLAAKPLLVSTTKRGEPDPPGELKGLEAARRLQGRVLTHAMAFLLTGERRFRDAAVAELDHALRDWPIWVDTAHQPPYDLMTGENGLTYAMAYDWLYDALTPAERQQLREGVERRALTGYLDATSSATPPFWFTARMNWNTVTNGGATMLALALGSDSALSNRVLDRAAPAMRPYWDELQPDGAWKEGTGYWTYGHRYAFMAAEALRRAGRPEGADYLDRPGASQTGFFPIVFNPGRSLSASFGDSPSRAHDPLFYLLARRYQNAAYAWFEDRAAPRPLDYEGWPEEALTLVWKSGPASGSVAGPAPASSSPPAIPPVMAFSSIGWAMLAPSQPDPPFFLAFKNGSLAADHTHLDLNHVSVGVGDTMVLVDLGNRPYPADYFDAVKRPTYYEISTAGHNAVLVGGQGQVSGRVGALSGPFEGRGYTAFVGVADSAYPTHLARARRHVVFVNNSYYVLLDDITPDAPTTFELRFHSYGRFTAGSGGRWTAVQEEAAVDIVPAIDEATGRPATTGIVESAAGWIRPVNVLRLGTGREPVSRLLAVTALFPRAVAGHAAADVASHPSPRVTQAVRGDQLVVEIGSDRLTWRPTADSGYWFSGVSVK
jgi:hypothetical protein